MSEDTSLYTATVKFGAGYDAPWVVVRADTPEELSTGLRLLDEELLGHVADTAVLAAGVYNVAKGTAPTAEAAPAAPTATPPQAQQPSRFSRQPAAVPAGLEQPSCIHGPMQWKEGISKAGKPYRLWSCTGPRAQECQAVYPPR